MNQISEGRPRFVDLPDILTPADVMKYVPMGRNAIYNSLKAGDLRSIRKGQKYLTSKVWLKEWLGGCVE